MSNYFTRDELLTAGLITKEVKYKGKMLLVQEMPAEAVNEFFSEGVINIEGEDNVEVDSSRMNFIKIASVCLIDHETKKPLFTETELGKLPFALVQLVASTAMEITDWGSGELDIEEAKKD